MIQFYAPEIESTGILPEGESSHCVRVLRMKEGDRIRVTDGKGSIYLCEIRDANPRQTKVDIIERHKPPKGRDYHLTLAVAPTKNSDRIEWLAEKAVEIGVDRIVLLKCERSERKNQRSDRLRKVMVSAMNQSLAAELPQLEDMTDFKDFVRNTSDDADKFFGYCSADRPRKEFVDECKSRGEIVVMIGPEGDFTPGEVSLAENHGFKAVTFGEKRLRTETAGVFAVSAVNILNRLRREK